MLIALAWSLKRAGLLFCLVSLAQAAASDDAPVDWPVVGGDAGGMRYSSLTDINRGNVQRLKLAWTYRHGDYRSGWPQSDLKGTAFQATPLMIDGRLIFSTPFNRLIALDPETGKELWVFDPKIDRSRRYANKYVSRGVAYWHDTKANGLCAARVFLGTLDARLIALDAATGKPCGDFGSIGTVNLLEGIEPLVDAWEYNVTSPPTIVGDRVIVGSAIADLIRRIQPPGAVRAFDARSGKLLWRFDTLPREGEFGADTWQNESWRDAGGASVWSVMTADVERGLVFLPVKPAGPDHYGGDRHGDNLFSNAIVALDVTTGKRVWHFQTVHHDVWDQDLAAPPNLVRLQRDGQDVDAVVQLTKMGFAFVFDRVSGAPLFPIEERRVAHHSELAGERLSPTQPVPTRPAPLVPQTLNESDLWADHPYLQRCRKRLASLRNEGIFTPPAERGSILYPGPIGGANWSGGAYDPVSGYLYVPTNNLAVTLRLKKLPRELLAEGGIPCNRPPWGTLSAIDLNRSEIVWQVPVGHTKQGIAGSMNFGPPLVTAGGIVFHAGGAEAKLRAHDARSGEILATYDLPAGLHAGPISYKLKRGGKQYLVVAPGGYVGLSKLGDYVMAFLLPD